MEKPQDLSELVAAFQSIIKLCHSYPTSNITAQILSELYLRVCACWVMSCAERCLNIDGIPNSNAKHEESACLEFPSCIPRLSAIQDGAQKLMDAVESKDGPRALNALEMMGIVVLCPVRGQETAFLESLVRTVPGRAQRVPLVELALIALEFGDCERAERLVCDANRLGPTPSDLHDMHSVEGIVALKRGEIAKAISCLEDSVNVCMADELALLECCIHPPNLMLARELLDYGKRTEVSEFLAHCGDIWNFARDQFALWVAAIQNGETLDLAATGILAAMNHPRVRMNHLCTLAAYPDDERRLSTAKTKAAAMKGRELILEEFNQEYGDFLRRIVARWPGHE